MSENKVKTMLNVTPTGQIVEDGWGVYDAEGATLGTERTHAEARAYGRGYFDGFDAALALPTDHPLLEGLKERLVAGGWTEPEGPRLTAPEFPPDECRRWLLAMTVNGLHMEHAKARATLAEWDRLRRVEAQFKVLAETVARLEDAGVET